MAKTPAENDTCPVCGARLVRGETGTNCPKCLLAEGLEDSTSGAGAGTAPSAPTPEELSVHFPTLEILELVGQGGMGIVYKARQVSLDRIVALKILPPNLAGGPSFADRFAREAKTMAKLDHTNIVRIFEFGEADGLYYLVMEFVDGLNLRQLMEAGGVEPREALLIIPQVCDALQFAHDLGIVHRDVKPENVLLDKDGRVKITDFGLAKLLDRRAADARITGTGQVMGTAHYMAPEQYRTPGQVDHRADIFSLGVVFYELLTGELPIGRFSPPSASVQVDVRLDQVVLRALEKERECRFQRVAEVKTEVDSILTHPTPPPAPEPPPAPKVSREDPEYRDRGPARLSKLALFGFLCSPAALILPILVVLLSQLTGMGSTWLLVAAPVGALLPLGFVLSLAGWISIAKSDGALKGLPFAIIGTFSPGLVFLFLGFVSMLFLSVDEPRERPEPGFVTASEIPAPPEPAAGPWLVVPESQRRVHGRLLDLWRQIARAEQQGGWPVQSAGEYYAKVDAARIALLAPDTRERLGKKGLLGVPLLVQPGEDLYLDMYDEFQFRGGTPSGVHTVEAKYGTRRLVFDLVEENGKFKFALTPVRKTATDEAGNPLSEAGAKAAARLFLAIWRDLWSQEHIPPRAVIPAGALPDLFPPSRMPALRERGVPGLVADGATGRIGLLFTNPESVAGQLEDYRVVTVELSEDRQSARVQARGGEGGLLEFGIMFEAGRWWLIPGEAR